MTQPPLPFGMLLAGGKSTRLGRDKVLERVEGQTLLARSLGLLRQVCRQVVVSGRDPSILAGESALVRATPWLPDDQPGRGPMGGIATCLRARGPRGGPVLALACDLPFLDRETLDRLVWERAHRAPGTVMTTYFQPATGYIESLVAIYEPEALPLLEAAMADGGYKLSRAVPPALRHHIPYDPEAAQVFFNINFPADLALLRRVHAAAPPRAPALAC